MWTSKPCSCNHSITDLISPSGAWRHNDNQIRHPPQSLFSVPNTFHSPGKVGKGPEEQHKHPCQGVEKSYHSYHATILQYFFLFLCLCQLPFYKIIIIRIIPFTKSQPCSFLPAPSCLNNPLYRCFLWFVIYPVSLIIPPPTTRSS